MESQQPVRPVERLSLPVQLKGAAVHIHHGADEPRDLPLDNASGRTVWWKKASPWWLLAAMPLVSIASTAMLAPRVEVYTTLACAVHKPDILGRIVPQIALGQPLTLHESAASDFHTRRHDHLCAADPIVQAATAKLIAVISACTGVLSLLTTGWWSAYSDRNGRKRVLGITMLGLLLSDINFILVANFPKRFPGNYWFLVVGPIIEGCLGGLTTGVAANHAYLTDTTDEHHRSQIFSINAGLVFTGMAIGPTLGSLLIRFTGQTLSVFYASTICHFLYTLLVSIIIPESTTEEQMRNARLRYDARLLNSTGGFSQGIMRFFAFFGPLSIFVTLRPKTYGSVLNNRRRDWNLALLAIAYGSMLSIVGSYQYKFQYAAFQFGWSSEQIGYWLGLLGVSRAVFMIAILPAAIKLLKPKPLVVQFPSNNNVTEATRLLESSNVEPGPSSTPNSPNQTIVKRMHSPSFDLGLAKLSLVVDIIVYFFLAISQSAWQYTLFSVLSSLGMGFNPAMHSVTSALYARQGGTESGRLFGAMSVIQALCSQILGPALYGFVYARTIARFPRAIFFVTLVTIVISLVLLLLVRLPSDDENEDAAAPTDGSMQLVDDTPERQL